MRITLYMKLKSITPTIIIYKYIFSSRELVQYNNINFTVMRNISRLNTIICSVYLICTCASVKPMYAYICVRINIQ